MTGMEAVVQAFARFKAEQHGTTHTDPPGLIRRWVVGSHRSCDVQVDDGHVSVRHCEVAELADGRYMVRDLGSLNGTWLRSVNGQQVRVYGWTPWLPGVALVIGRSAIPRPVGPVH